ncbi:hypothetical protein [Methylobacterium sp. SI9]|uniref:hypothetical protein n=1 Tax=Methylobacterium guangdongense TaxID=3138811 RepID=UPI00313DFFD5
MAAPKMTAAMRKERLADVSAKRESDISINRDEAIAPSRDIEVSPEPAPAATAKTLPKVTLYAHQDVLKALRMVAVQDGVQAQEILRRAVRDYLATRGHTFTDLTTGR